MGLQCEPLGAERHGALEMLAGSSLGCTEALLAHGFTTDLLVDLVQEGLATATPETVHAGKRPIEVVQVRITDAGRLGWPEDGVGPASCASGTATGRGAAGLCPPLCHSATKAVGVTPRRSVVAEDVRDSSHGRAMAAARYLAEPRTEAVTGIRRHTAEAHIDRHYAINLRQSVLRLCQPELQLAPTATDRRI
jgi:hypothetical protein